MQQRGNKNKNCCISLLQYNTDLIWRNCQTCEIILVYMNYFLSWVAFYSSYMYMFCVELRLQGKKSFSMILFFIISFLDFDKNIHIHTQKICLAPDIHVCSEHLLKIHCWKRKSPEYWEGIQALQIISTYFLKSILFFLQCPLFLDGQVHSLKYAKRTLYKIFEIVLLNIDHTGIQCHVSLFSDYTGCQ